MRHKVVWVALCTLLTLTAAGDEMDWQPETKWRRGKGTTVASLIRKAETAQARAQYKQAAKLYRQITDRAMSMGNRAKAVVMQGICLERMNKPHDANAAFARAVEEFGSLVPFAMVQQRQLDIANRFYFGEKDKVLGLSFSNLENAQEIYDHIAEYAPYGDRTAVALYRAGLIAQQVKDFGGSIERFEMLLKRFPSHELAIDARIDLANSLLLWAAQGDGDGTLVARAKRELESVRNAASGHSRATELRTLLRSSREMEAARLLYLGEFYQREAHPRFAAARRYLQKVVSEFSDTSSAEAAGALLTALNMHAAAVGEEADAEDDLLPPRRSPGLPLLPQEEPDSVEPRPVAVPEAPEAPGMSPEPQLEEKRRSWFGKWRDQQQEKRETRQAERDRKRLEKEAKRQETAGGREAAESVESGGSGLAPPSSQPGTSPATAPARQPESPATYSPQTSGRWLRPLEDLNIDGETP